MKRLIVLFFFMIGNLVISQSKYSFDYALLYDITSTKFEHKFQNIYYVNASNNKYFLHTSKNKDSINMNLYFSDFRGISVFSKVAKIDFYKAEKFTCECSSVHKFTDSSDYNTKDYAFKKRSDTLINDSLYYHYVIKSVKSYKYQKRKKIQSMHIIIDKNSDKFQPILFHPLLDLFVKSPELPNGLFKMIYYTNINGEITFKKELKQVFKIDKSLTIPDECNFVKSPK